MGLYNHSTDRSPRLIKTRIEKDESDFIMPSSAKEIFATLDRLTRPINRGNFHKTLYINSVFLTPQNRQEQNKGLHFFGENDRTLFY